MTKRLDPAFLEENGEGLITAGYQRTGERWTTNSATKWKHNRRKWNDNDGKHKKDGDDNVTCGAQ